MPDCALTIFLSILAFNSAPAAIVLLAGGVCWATTLALVACLSAGIVTLLSVSIFFLLQWFLGGPLPAGVVALLLQLASARVFYLAVFVQRASGRSSRLSIVALHDKLHGVAN